MLQHGITHAEMNGVSAVYFFFKSHSICNSTLQELDCGVQAAKLMVKTKAQKNGVDS